MARNLDLAEWDEKEVSIQDQLPGSMTPRSIVSDLKSRNSSIILPEVCPKSITSTNDSGEYAI